MLRAGLEPNKPTNRAAADLRLRPRGHWDSLRSCFLVLFLKNLVYGNFVYKTVGV